MARLLWIVVLSLLFVAGALQVFSTLSFVKLHQPLILTTPHGLSLIPLAYQMQEGIYYFRQYVDLQKGAAIQSFRYVQALLPIYSVSFFFAFTAFFLYVFARVRRMERAYIIFSIAVVIYLLLLADYLTRDFTGSLFLSYNIFIIGPFLYLFRSAYQLPTQGMLYLGIFLLSILAAILIPVRTVDDEIRFIHILGGIFALTFLYCVYLFIWSEKHPDRVATGRRLWAARIFNAALMFSVVLPPAAFFALYYIPLQVDMSYNALFFLPTIFPVLFMTLCLRWGLVNFHIPISLMAVRFLYFAFFGLLYWFTIGFSLGEIYQMEQIQAGHIWVIAFFLLFIDPFRTSLLTSLDKHAASRKRILDSILLKSSQQVANPRRINLFIDRLALQISEGLGTHWAKFVLSRDLFQNWSAESDRVLLLPADQPLWVQIKAWIHPVRHPVLTQTFVGPVRDFLQAQGAFMMVSMGKFKAGILVSERKDKMPFYSEDVQFLRQVVKESEILIQNYLFLIERVKLRRRERELAFSARIQKHMIPTFRQFEPFTFWSYSRAYESVTGDYIDLIQVEPDKFVVILGDVSGHGISSGYLVVFARAYLRGAMVGRGESLEKAVNGLNQYFVEYYRGNEFITLFALQLTFKTDAIALSYINAGQHPALVYTNEKFLRLEESQRLLGVIPNNYHATELEISSREMRILLFSDGAFDVFNKAGRLLGQKKFFDWVSSSIKDAPADQLAFLRRRIEGFTDFGDESDDLTLVIIETH